MSVVLYRTQAGTWQGWDSLMEQGQIPQEEVAQAEEVWHKVSEVLLIHGI